MSTAKAGVVAGLSISDSIAASLAESVSRAADFTAFPTIPASLSELTAFPTIAASLAESAEIPRPRQWHSAPPTSPVGLATADHAVAGTEGAASWRLVVAEELRTLLAPRSVRWTLVSTAFCVLAAWWFTMYVYRPDVLAAVDGPLQIVFGAFASMAVTWAIRR
jgi:hypothetical protein